MHAFYAGLNEPLAAMSSFHFRSVLTPASARSSIATWSRRPSTRSTRPSSRSTPSCTGTRTRGSSTRPSIGIWYGQAGLELRPRWTIHNNANSKPWNVFLRRKDEKLNRASRPTFGMNSGPFTGSGTGSCSGSMAAEQRKNLEKQNSLKYCMKMMKNEKSKKRIVSFHSYGSLSLKAKRTEILAQYCKTFGSY